MSVKDPYVLLLFHVVEHQHLQSELLSSLHRVRQVETNEERTEDAELRTILVFSVSKVAAILYTTQAGARSKMILIRVDCGPMTGKTASDTPS